jgi:hypothetical protein
LAQDEDEAEDEGDKLAAEERISEKMSFRQQQQFESGKTSGRGRLHTHELALC